MDKRATIAFIVFLIVSAVWFFVVVPLILPKQTPPPKPPQNQTQQQQQPSNQNDNQTQQPVTQQQQPPPTTDGLEATESEPAAESCELKNDYVRATFTSAGAGLSSVSTTYKQNEITPPVLLPPYAHFTTPVPFGKDTANWKMSTDAQKGEVVFLLKTNKAVEIRKTFRLKSRLIELEFFFKNSSSEAVTLPLTHMLIFGIGHDQAYRYEGYWQVLDIKSDGNSFSSSTHSLPDVEKADIKFEKFSWVGIKNRYFVTLFHPYDDDSREFLGEVKVRKFAEGEIRLSGYKNGAIISTKAFEIKGPEARRSFQIYVGPFTKDDLGAATTGLGQIVDLPGPDFIAEFISWLLALCHSMTASWGIAIILCTILIRLVMFPLDKKNTVSMYRLQQLGPKIEFLKEKYKDNQRKFAEEQMKLWRGEGVNPMTGCLVMALQLPIFIAMFGVFDTDLNIRGSAFLWAKDLAQPDRLHHLEKPVSILVMTIEDINLLPIIMTVVWVVQSFLAPRSADPKMKMQQNMMLIMPVVFGFLCYSYAAGLSIYFLANAGASIVTQTIIKKYYLKLTK